MCNLYKRFFFIIPVSAALFALVFGYNKLTQSALPIVAIANYGPHQSLQDSINGIKDELAKRGFIEGRNVQYAVMDVGFNFALISQMLTKLKSLDPKVIVAMTTPVAQSAKALIKDIPIVFNVITDPVRAGLINNALVAENNITGTSDKQDLSLLLQFAKRIIPQSKKIGVLHAVSEANDTALVQMLQTEAAKLDMQVVAIPVEQSKDIPSRVDGFERKVDFIYLGVGGTVQPFLDIISAKASKMKIPVFNADSDAVKKHLVLGSYGVNSYTVGVNAGIIIDQILRGKDVKGIKPIYPNADDHLGYISRKQANAFGITIPTDLQNIKIVE